jgi:tryptophan-rich sensory protein
MTKRIFLFLILNFGSLALSGLFTPSGVNSEWYTSLNKAPWAPPGWLFGVAWTTIMICLTAYMAISLKEKNKLLIGLYSLQFVLNTLFTPVFFHFQNAIGGLIIITLLTLLIGSFIILFRKNKNTKSILLAPYLIWLCLATSLNLYIVMNNEF